jgi:hypothetical protein
MRQDAEYRDQDPGRVLLADAAPGPAPGKALSSSTTVLLLRHARQQAPVVELFAAEGPKRITRIARRRYRSTLLRLAEQIRNVTDWSKAMKRGAKPLGERAMTPAERQARYREAHRDGTPKLCYRRPADGAAGRKRWRDAVAELVTLQDDYRAWLDSLPENLAESVSAEAQIARNADQVGAEEPHNEKKKLDRRSIPRSSPRPRQAAFKMPSCVSAVTPSSRPTSSAIMRFSTRSTVVPVKCIFRPDAAGSEPTRKSLNAGPV